MPPEAYVECCEWCGKDTAVWGRFYLQGGPGMKMVLCGPCARDAEYACRYNHDFCGEIVCSPMIADR